MDEIKKLINKKLNRLGIKKRINEIAVCKNVDDFLKNYLKHIHPKEINLFNRILIIKVANALEANELKFFEEELKFFLAQKGYQVNKIKIIF